MINVIIVDDEPLAQDILESHIQKMPDLNLVQKCSNALEANEALRQHNIDLMFLDIQMPQLTGIDFLKSLSKPPQVIFTTAYSNYAVDGFELNALDYLLKPISLDRFMKAANKAVEHIQMQRGQNPGSSNMKAADESNDFIFVKSDKKLVRVYYKDIIYIEGLKDYVMIRQNESRIVTLQTMKSLEQKLPSSIFQRIHRSIIVNIGKIDAVMGNMVEVQEKGQAKHLPVGKNYREVLQGIIDEKRL